MRIGKLAEAAGVSTRTVRHYHQIGLLPEPSRTASGYRKYALRDLVRLSHARRLVELGLSLEEVRDVLADEEGRELGEIIEAMDAELALQQERLAVQRRRLTELRARVREGRLNVDDLPERDLVEFFTRVEAAGATGPIARLDRDVLSFVPGHEARRWIAPMLDLMGDEEYTHRLVQMYDDFDRIADLPADDPQIDELVTEILDLLPEESLRELASYDVAELAAPSVLDAMFAELTPAQTEVARLLLERAHDQKTREKEN